MGRPDDSSSRFIELCKEMMAERRLILVSNRGPVEYNVTEYGRLQGRRGSGGVVTALSAISQYVELTWVASAMGEGDRRASEESQNERLRSPLPGQKMYLRFVVTPRSVYHKYYNIFCNPLLWFLQHYMWNSPYTPNITATTYDAWHNGYVKINQAFAEATIAEAGASDPPPIIMLHDYHLYLVGGFIRSQMPNAVLQHFTHIPWPSPGYWQLLPEPIRKAICEGLCANDIVGLQTMNDVHNFLHTCAIFIEGAEVDYNRHTVWANGHLTQVNSYPISIDVAELQRVAKSPRVREYQEKLQSHCGQQTIVRVDRAEPSKNIVRGFRSFDLLLQRYPHLVGKVKFLAFLVPTRTHIKQYQRYIQEINELVDLINARYGTEDWQPIKIFYENNYPQAIAGMRIYNVLIVNSVIDGMNLVAKEGPTVNTRDGVLILSEAVGAHEQLRGNALSVAPTDLEGTTQALYTALSMPPDERKRMANALRKSIEEADVTTWLHRQFEDLLALAQEQRRSTTPESAPHQPLPSK